MSCGECSRRALAVRQARADLSVASPKLNRAVQSGRLSAGDALVSVSMLRAVIARAEDAQAVHAAECADLVSPGGRSGSVAPEGRTGGAS